MNSQFEQALKAASYIGAQKAYNRIRERHGLEKSAAPIVGGAMGALPLINAIVGAVKSKEGEKLSGAGRGALQGLGQMGGGILGGLAGLLTGPGAILGVPAGLGAGAYGGDKLMSKFLGGDPEYRKEASALLGNVAKGGGMANAFSNVLKSKGGKAALLGTGLLGTAGASAYGGAQYGKNKTIDTIKTNMDNQSFMDRLKTIFQYLMGNSGAVMNNLGLKTKAPTGA